MICICVWFRASGQHFALKIRIGSSRVWRKKRLGAEEKRLACDWSACPKHISYNILWGRTIIRKHRNQNACLIGYL